MRLYFVRHGEREANRLREFSNRGLKHPLTPEGRRQVLALSEKLRAQGLAQGLSSPLLRALETSILLASALGVPYRIEPRLCEIDEGELEGRTDEAAWRQWEELNRRWLGGEPGFRLPGRESLAEARGRLAGLLADLARQPPGNRVLVRMALWPLG